jgi:hypothetical protein
MPIPSNIIKSPKNILIKGKSYLFENFRNNSNKSRWRTKQKCVNCGKVRLVEKRMIQENKFNTGLCQECNWVKGGKNHIAYKGGRHTNGRGYVNLLLEKDDKFYSMLNRTGYVLEHRYIVANDVGRPLKDYEHVHHLNGIKTDNRIENLVLIDGSIHQIVTALEEKIKRLEVEIKLLKGEDL